jgi:NAD(P)-dependent dehydrogenase (short-subunit alcohol dehydrogenase family)
MPELTDRVALVTGSSRGIGAAIARLFARAGAAVAVHGRDEAALAAVRTQSRPRVAARWTWPPTSPASTISRR